MKLIIVTGMPGAGKSEVADAFKDTQFPVLVMGDIVRKEARNRGLEPNRENTRLVMLDLRDKDGLGAIAMRCVPELKRIESEIVLIEGCRSISEIDVFDDYAKELTLVAVHASPRTRFARLQKRNRDDAPDEWSSFRERDLREISVGLGGVIALSDVMLVNESSLESFRESIDKLVRSFL